MVERFEEEVYPTSSCGGVFSASGLNATIVCASSKGTGRFLIADGILFALKRGKIISGRNSPGDVDLVLLDVPPVVSYRGSPQDTVLHR